MVRWMPTSHAIALLTGVSVLATFASYPLLRNLGMTSDQPTRTHRRILDSRAALADQPQPENAERAYCARELVIATLPHQNPKGNPAEWFRQNGAYTLSIRPGYKTDAETGERICIGYPFGVIPRLLLFWMTTEVLRTRERRLQLSDSLNGFMREIGLSPETGGGKRSDYRRLRDQSERLFRATISFDYSSTERSGWLDMPIAPHGEMWWSPAHPDQSSMFGSWVELGEKFYEAILAHPVPLDLRAIRALKSSPLALDLYAWISYRHFRACRQDKPAFIPWRELKKQLGASYGNVKDFKRYAKQGLRKLLALYPHLTVEDIDGGLQIKPGRPLIADRTR